MLKRVIEHRIEQLKLDKEETILKNNEAGDHMLSAEIIFLTDVITLIEGGL